MTDDKEFGFTKITYITIYMYLYKNCIPFQNNSFFFMGTNSFTLLINIHCADFQFVTKIDFVLTESNSTLEILDLSWNQITKSGAQALAVGLRVWSDFTFICQSTFKLYFGNTIALNLITCTVAVQNFRLSQNQRRIERTCKYQGNF
jgi:hypothetical protein